MDAQTALQQIQEAASKAETTEEMERITEAVNATTAQIRRLAGASPGRPILDRNAQSMAQYAFLWSEGTTDIKISAAITAYLWASERIEYEGDRLVKSPKLEDLRNMLSTSPEYGVE